MDDRVNIEVDTRFVQTSDDTRVLHFKVGEYRFQLVDIRVLHFGASYTLRSIRCFDDDDDSSDPALLNETTNNSAPSAVVSLAEKAPSSVVSLAEKKNIFYILKNYRAYTKGLYGLKAPRIIYTPDKRSLKIL